MTEPVDSDSGSQGADLDPDEYEGRFRRYLRFFSAAMKLVWASKIAVFGLDMIDRVGPGGHFLTEKHTIDRMRQTWHPHFFDRDSFAGWENAGSQTMEVKLNRKLQWILENHRAEPPAPEVNKAIEAIIAKAEVVMSK